MRNPERAPQLAEITARERLPIRIHRLDVDFDDSVRECFAGIREPIQALVNNAGVETHGSIEELPMEAFVATMNTNYFGAVRCMKAVLPAMREAREGCIVNISSVAGRIANSPLGPYAASKWALEAISEALAGEVKAFNIRVALVEPGIQDTKMARRDREYRRVSISSSAAIPGAIPCGARESRAPSNHGGDRPLHHRERNMAAAASIRSRRHRIYRMAVGDDR
jgi:NAD(P)-dependent dehydrogenase (short-subunit alcohol dehydrogenase family)